MWYIKLALTGLIPVWLLRLAIRLALNIGLWLEKRLPFAQQESARQALLARLRASSIAIHTDKPNQQHYEVPTAFFEYVLGSRLKYSCCLWEDSATTLDQAEEAMLKLTCERARIEDGMEILDLGCGWGSFSIFTAQKFPRASITALSNSRTQKRFIDGRCAALNITNIRTVIADVASAPIPGRYDRVVSIEMFEHMKNYQELMRRIAGALKPDGRLFVHIFSNTRRAHEFNAGDPNSWMAQTFFTGGLMSSDDLLLHFQDDMVLEEHWRLNGLHYTKTLNAWYARMVQEKAQVLPVLDQTYGRANRVKWWVNWTLFFIGCAETWRLYRGQEYIVSHYLFARRLS